MKVLSKSLTLLICIFKNTIFLLMYRMACRCLWDSDTDSYAQDVFMNVCFKMCNTCNNVFIPGYIILCCSSIRYLLLLTYMHK